MNIVMIKSAGVGEKKTQIDKRHCKKDYRFMMLVMYSMQIEAHKGKNIYINAHLTLYQRNKLKELKMKLNTR